MPQVNQTPSETPAQDALNQALVGACHSPAATSELIEAFRAEVMTQAGTSLSELGYGSAGGLLVDTAEVIRPRAANPETAADKERADTFPAWLARRMDPRGQDWGAMSDEDRSYWEHEARAVRRAVARGGFKNEEAGR